MVNMCMSKQYTFNIIWIYGDFLIFKYISTLFHSAVNKNIFSVRFY